MVTELNQSIGRLIPARLREAREAAGFNMTELADKIGVTVASISQYESDDKQPEWETMMKICGELKQPISYFTSPRPAGGKKQSPVFFRSFKSKTKTTHKMLNQWRAWGGQFALYIGKFVNLPSVVFPEFQAKDSYTDDEIENFAKECRRFWGLGEGPIANMVALFENKGIIVIRAKFGVENVDAFSCWQDERPFVFLGDDKASSARSRYDAAHELGHLLLHKNLTDDQIENSEILERIEHEANRFASAFLLPAKTFCAEVFSASLKHFEQLKRRWKVSIAAMIYRCKDLGIFDEYQYVNLRKQLSYHKMLKKEPLDDELELEEASLFEKSVELLISKGIKRASDFISEMTLHPRAIASIGNFSESIFEEEADSGIVIPLNLKTA